MTRHVRLGIGLALIAAVALQAPAASARTLYWRSLEVRALIDADGSLHVRERHAMVFSGAWNGGERAFDIRGDQRLELLGVSRVDPGTRQEQALTRGSLDVVDNYDWFDRQTLRWRSRLPTDPEFDNTEITYVIDYLLSGVLVQNHDAYRLDHDFAFPDRDGAIETFRLDLELDPAWQAPSGLALRLERGPLAPGESVVMTTDLAFRGEGTPAAVQRFAPAPLRAIPLALALLAAAASAWRFVRHERNQGRFLPASAPATLDRDWLEDNVFSLRPEVAGALWDGSVASAEVSALIARWVQDGLVSSTVRTTGRIWTRQILELELRADRDDFTSYERRLLDKLFFSGRTRTDTDALEQHYRSTGFSPADTIRPAIERRLRELPGMGRAIDGPDRTPGCFLLIAFVALLALEYWQGRHSALVLAATLILTSLLPMVVAYSLAYRYRRRCDGLVAAALWVAAPLFLLFVLALGAALASSLLGAFTEMRLGWFGLCAIAVFFLMITHSVLNSARTRESRARVAKRKQLCRARQLFIEELGKDAPDLDDDWLPYLLAFGLDRRVDRWFRAFGADASRRLASAATRAGGSGASGGSAWTGGGGAFGGAGATAAWTAAAGSIAAGVSAPSSSGSGGSSGGGGGGSSGGGGGGGW